MTWNRGSAAIFAEGQLSIGLFFPIQAFPVGARPDMSDQLGLAQTAETLGFRALWARDVPLDDPGFGDPGQIYDPFVWLTAVAGVTKTIALATGASVLPLHPALDTAKQAASLDALSGGRFVLGTASGDRPVEFGVFDVDHATRGERFRQHFEMIKTLLQGGRTEMGEQPNAPRFLPQPEASVPMLITGFSQSAPEWGAAWADGLLTYPRPPEAQEKVAARWRSFIPASAFKPVAQSLYVDLTADPDAAPAPIHLGWRLGRTALVELLTRYRTAGINHVALILRFNQRRIDETLDEIATHILPHFHSGDLP